MSTQKETTDLLNQVDISPGTNFVATLITNVGAYGQSRCGAQLKLDRY